MDRGRIKRDVYVYVRRTIVIEWAKMCVKNYTVVNVTLSA